ncbi:MAG: hypothetical protein WD851_13385 [Pirellulales bacterium]
MRHAIAYGIGLTFLLAGISSAKAEPEAVTIPLDQIWGYNFPGTRDIAGIPLPEPKGVWETDARFREQREGVIERMRQALVSKPPTQKALPGFVLPRHADFYTLQRASAHLSEDSKLGPPNRAPAKKTYSVDDELTLVFFSYPASYYVRLKEVKRSGREIKVLYQFEPHASVETTVHFALIPLGKLPAGDYRVDFEQIPMDQKYSDAGFALVPHSAVDLVSRPFSFEVWEPAEPEPLSDGATRIPLDQIWAFRMPGTKDVGKLDANKTETGTIYKILMSLGKRPEEGEKAAPAFVVEGTGQDALKTAATVLIKTAEAPHRVAADTDLALVFYSYSCGQFVHIVSVEQSDKQIRILYQFVGHATTNMTRHFALIPIGRLSPGEVEVIIEQTASINERGDERPPLRGLERLVCDSFSFEVR